MPRAGTKKKRKHEPRGARRKELGESRGIYVKATVDEDFLALSVNGKLLWYTLKMHLGASGIGVMMQGTLADLTGIPYGDIEGTLRELEGTNWIRRERNVIWFRNGLRFDPYMTTENPLHITAILRHIAGLPKLAIVNDFCAYYGLKLEWLTKGVPDTDQQTVVHTDQQTVGDTVSQSVCDTGGRRKEVGSRSKELGGKPEQKAISHPAVPTGPESRANGAFPPSEQPDGFAIASQRQPSARHRAADVISQVYHLGQDVVELGNGYRESLEIALNRFDGWVEAKGVDPVELTDQMALIRSVEDFEPDEPITVSTYLGPDRVVTRTRCEAEWLKRQPVVATLEVPDVPTPGDSTEEFERKRAIAREQIDRLRKANA